MERIKTEFEVTVSDFRKASYYGMFTQYRKPLRIMFVVLGLLFAKFILELFGVKFG